MAGPLEQFQIQEFVPLVRIGEVAISVTNASVAMGLSVLVFVLFSMRALAHPAMVPGRIQSLVEILYQFVASMVRENAGEKGMAFLPLVLSLFVFILFGNLFGMLPLAFTFTSHIIITFSLAILVFVLTTMIGIICHGTKFLTLFVPSGVPKPLLILMTPIEIISYLSRPISLSLRLFANMVAGHIMLKVFASFVFLLGVFGIAPFLITGLLTAFEFLVAFLQAYVFAVLTCLYLHDALYLH